MKKLLYLLPILFLSFSCDENDTSFAESCRQLWAISAPTEFNMAKDESNKIAMSNRYIVRCCELVDGGDNPSEQSKKEGACMSELLLEVELGVAPEKNDDE